MNTTKVIPGAPRVRVEDLGTVGLIDFVRGPFWPTRDARAMHSRAEKAREVLRGRGWAPERIAMFDATCNDWRDEQRHKAGYMQRRGVALIGVMFVPRGMGGFRVANLSAMAGGAS